jgi:putative flippase GtrA
MQTEQSRKPDIFDRMMKKGFLKKFEPFYKQYKEMLLYLFFGGCTTVVGLIFYALPISFLKLGTVSFWRIKIDLDVQVSNVISWICAVTFAYITNRTWVFEDKAHGAKPIANECAAFFAGRFFTLIVENILLNISTQTLSMGDYLAKIIVSVVTIILNYIISKLFVFKKKTEEK